MTRTGPGGVGNTRIGVAVAREAYQDEGWRDAIAWSYRLLYRGHVAVIYNTLRDHQDCPNPIP